MDKMFEKYKENFLWQAAVTVFRNPFYAILCLSLSFSMLAVYYILLYRVTTLEVFLSSNTAFYNWLSLGMSVITAVMFGMAASFLVWQWQEKKQADAGHGGNTFLASFFGALSVGCPACGAFLVSLLGIGGGLFAFPFQGLEIKAISIGMLGWSIFASAKLITGKTCSPVKSLRPLFLGIALFALIISLPAITGKFNIRFPFQPKTQQASIVPAFSQNISAEDLINQINPPEGFELNISYGNIGPKLVEIGAIDFEAMRTLYENGGRPLTQEQIKILTEGSDQKIKITSENAHFLLNFLWALGLANKNIILDEGPMVQYGQDQIGNFASTGGWTLGKKQSTELYSKFPIIVLNQKQQTVLEDFAFNSYRPCCSNPTGFPDCNHGMAALALGELMAANGASVDEIFEAFKYFNAFWFPQTYLDAAKYFQAKEGKNWNQVSGRTVAGADYSTPQGWQRVRQWLSDNNLIEKAPSGGGCGV